jgi:hypothetical protein
LLKTKRNGWAEYRLLVAKVGYMLFELFQAALGYEQLYFVRVVLYIIKCGSSIKT